ncbi:MAG: hypothetical protein IT256_06020 [Chitinophagaceae bacterium]|nr:hypothetical protein [Chitinophagaceae bacterium]
MFTKPPIIFPLVALFHLLMTLSAVYTLYPTPLQQIDWARPISLLVFTILAFSLCFLKKWAAIGYIILSMTCLGLLYNYPNDDSIANIVGKSNFPLSLIFSLFILLLYKKFR